MLIDFNECGWQPLLCRHFGGQELVDLVWNTMERTNGYADSLSGLARERYVRKIRCLYGFLEDGDQSITSLDPYNLPESVWEDDIHKWPPVDYPDIYNYLIESPGEFTREKLKAYKSLEAYNYYIR